MVEVVVMISILTAISAIVLFSFTGLNQGAALNRSIRELALALRRAQNMSLAVSQVEVGGALLIPPAIGIQLQDEAQSYLIFGDLPGSRDNKYTSLAEKIGPDLLFERGVKVESLIDGNNTSHVTVHIIFTAPEAAITLTDVGGGAMGSNDLVITLSPPSGQPKKTVTVRTSGQISIK